MLSYGISSIIPFYFFAEISLMVGQFPLPVTHAGKMSHEFIARKQGDNTTTGHLPVYCGNSTTEGQWPPLTDSKQMWLVPDRHNICQGQSHLWAASSKVCPLCSYSALTHRSNWNLNHAVGVLLNWAVVNEIHACGNCEKQGLPVKGTE